MIHHVKMYDDNDDDDGDDDGDDEQNSHATMY